MKTELLSGTACAALCLLAFGGGTARSATLDDVMARLDKIERENAELKQKIKAMQSTKSGPATPGAVAGPAAEPPKGNPVLHAGVATSPAPAAPPPVPGMPVKASAFGPIVDNTVVTLYGHFDLSGDIFNPSVFDQGTKFGIASNSSYFGVRARHNLAPYGWDGWSIVAQMEAQIDAAAAATERAALGTRDTFVGLEGPWGSVKAGKSDTPYKKATAAFDPFANTLGDYNALMGNTGGDNRAEFDWRMNHAIWYESPIVSGFQFSALISPGQNYAQDNSDYSYGDYFQCNGASTRGSGSNFPGTGGAIGGNIGGNGCTDGSYGNAYSAALTYKNGPFTAIAAYELHEQVNRHGDDGLEPGQIAPVTLADGSPVLTGVHNEWAAKVGGGYRFNDGIGDVQLYTYYEWMRREVTPMEEIFNERSRDGVFVSATQYVGKWALSASYAHAFRTPGNPAMLSFNDPQTAGQATLQGNLFDDSANLYAIGARYRFNQWASWYVVATELTQGPGAHYCLGASGHGYQVCSRDAANDTIGGATIRGATTGLTFDF
ncbi:MAG: porin [Bradyrhizobium sp.]|uniref:porin n=1 Tax=Bradyrhizobium sp. TaxID=376 RepID=UPI001E14A4C9|nr:porin [Bradyrhizobium sp.]MBV9564409.1 porin [Bradyrhizobium sp.]